MHLLEDKLQQKLQKLGDLEGEYGDNFPLLFLPAALAIAGYVLLFIGGLMPHLGLTASGGLGLVAAALFFAGVQVRATPNAKNWKHFLSTVNGWIRSLLAWGFLSFAAGAVLGALGRML